jgi:hypothetical protein
VNDVVNVAGYKEVKVGGVKHLVSDDEMAGELPEEGAVVRKIAELKGMESAYDDAKNSYGRAYAVSGVSYFGFLAVFLAGTYLMMRAVDIIQLKLMVLVFSIACLIFVFSLKLSANAMASSLLRMNILSLRLVKEMSDAKKGLGAYAKDDEVKR